MPTSLTQLFYIPKFKPMTGLRFVSDRQPGISRKRYRHQFHYFDTQGQRILDQQEIQRIHALAIPPAWTQVWICPSAHGHIQATGRDAKLRKQYRYHPRWRIARDEAKYAHMISFGKALPLIRQAVARALALPGLPREKVLAIIVDLLQRTRIRIGNEEYARQNKSYGLTTLKNRHIQIEGSSVKFQFKGKSGVEHRISITHKKLAQTIKTLKDLPGQDLFQYLDDTGQIHAIGSADVNEYLRTISGQDFSAKDFRTWYGTLEAARELVKFEPFSSASQAKRNIAEAIKSAAKTLGNTPAICRKCYVHPGVLNAYLAGTLSTQLPTLICKNGTALPTLLPAIADVSQGLSAEEQALLEFLQTEHA